MSQYFKPDCELGYVDDSAEISYLKFNNLRHTVLGCMLGDFDEQGCYYVSPQIVEELIEMPKFLVETIDNVEVCKSALKLDKHISFLVTFEQDKAILSLIEKISFEANLTINSGTYSNINEYVLDVVKSSGVINKNAIYARWNISPFGGNAVDVFNCDSSILEKYFNVINKFKLRLKENTTMLKNEEMLEQVEAEYFVEVMEILKRYPKLEKVVKEQLKEVMEQKKDFIKTDKPYFAKTVNEILDKVIETKKSVLSKEQQQEFQTEMRNVKNDTAIKRGDVLPIKATVVAEEKDLKFKTTNTETLTRATEEKDKDVKSENVENKETKKKPTEAHKPGVPVVTTEEVANEDLFTIATQYIKAQQRKYKFGTKKLIVSSVEKQEENKTLTPEEKMLAIITGMGVGYLAGGPLGALAGAATAQIAAEVVAEVKGENKAKSTTDNKKALAPKKDSAQKSGAKSSGEKSAAKKPAAKKPAAKKPTVKKPALTLADSPAIKKDDDEMSLALKKRLRGGNRSAYVGPRLERRGLVSEMVGSGRISTRGNVDVVVGKTTSSFVAVSGVKFKTEVRVQTTEISFGID